MSTLQEPKPAKLVIGLFLKEKALLPELARELAVLYGPVDLVSPWMPFDHTDYYEAEMGGPLFRRLLVFRDLLPQGDLAAVKVATNRIETVYARSGRRRVNIDPGYLVHERFVLASGKNFSHRIYIGRGVYADLTLIYHRGGFQKLPWTYPDYADLPIRGFLEKVRAK